MVLRVNSGAMRARHFWCVQASLASNFNQQSPALTVMVSVVGILSFMPARNLVSPWMNFRRLPSNANIRSIITKSGTNGRGRMSVHISWLGIGNKGRQRLTSGIGPSERASSRGKGDTLAFAPRSALAKKRKIFNKRAIVHRQLGTDQMP